ncbi:HCL295Wp [Eremothecium sinecaudum]|uniref:HCL295Wp n=1 Tax=Eremothecium sinecaudum TaxID=45286 RepID=A0A109UYH0_9SACH|nr:HCL295Wp [Eremothecium sinecaudum]AMD19856.1 HCL295Wp [Eremothecium sinecaudum]
MAEDDTSLYLEEQEKIYSRGPVNESMIPIPNVQFTQPPPLPPLPSMSQYAPCMKMSEKSLIGRMKHMLFKQNAYPGAQQGRPYSVAMGDNMPLGMHTQLLKQEQLWKIIKERPFEPHGVISGSPPSQPSSADTFLSGADQSPVKRQPVVIGRPTKAVSGLLNGGDSDPGGRYSYAAMGSLEGELNSSAALDIITYKILGHRKVGLKKIQDRLNEIAEKKFAVHKLYGKLTQEFNMWSNDVVESEEGLRLVEELQRVLKLDMVMERNFAQKFRDLAVGLNYIKLREDQMLIAKKEVNNDIKKYEAAKSKKGEYHEETSFWKELVNTKQNSLTEITILYQQALAKTMRELFTLSCVTFYENCTEMKEACKQFFSDSMEYLATTLGEEYVDEYLDELRKKRADKKWAKLSFEDKNNPNKLAELIGNMYNGEDSLLSSVPKKQYVKYSAEAILKDELEPMMKEKEPKLKIGIGLDEDDWSQFPSERYNGIASNKYFLERHPESVDNHDLKGGNFSFSRNGDPNKGSIRTLRGLTSKYTRSNNQVLSTTKEEATEDSPKPSLVGQGSLYQTLRPSSRQFRPQSQQHSQNKQQPPTEKSYQEVVMKFGSGGPSSLDLRFKEAEEELNTNKWVNSKMDKVES